VEFCELAHRIWQNLTRKTADPNYVLVMCVGLFRHSTQHMQVGVPVLFLTLMVMDRMHRGHLCCRQVQN